MHQNEIFEIALSHQTNKFNINLALRVTFPVHCAREVDTKRLFRYTLFLKVDTHDIFTSSCFTKVDIFQLFSGISFSKVDTPL